MAGELLGPAVEDGDIRAIQCRACVTEKRASPLACVEEHEGLVGAIERAHQTGESATASEIEPRPIGGFGGVADLEESSGVDEVVRNRTGAEKPQRARPLELS